jgi:hypothetical protein
MDAMHSLIRRVHERFRATACAIDPEIWPGTA